jgi:hypothetical protein
MSHNIYAVIARRGDLSEEQKRFFRDTGHPEFMIASLDHLVSHDIRLPSPRVQIITDYFGGCGTQEATFFDGKETHRFVDNTKGGAINAALTMLGVPHGQEQEDRFDVLDLTRFRSNDDLAPRPVCLQQTDHKELLATLEDLANWRAIIRLRKDKPPSYEFTSKDMEEMESLATNALKLARKGELLQS